jgi:hypothetical protein
MGKTWEKEFWIATALIILTTALMGTIILHWIRIGFYVGPFRLNHWFVLAGTLYIASVVPVIAYAKKRIPRKYVTLRRTHIFGNLLAFMLISLHFASQISRPAASYPELGTGIVLYVAMSLLVASGFVQRFQLMPKVKPQDFRFVHIGSALTFYLIIVIHILHGLAIL